MYSDLAWANLSEAPIFDEYFKDRENEKERILNRYRCESTGNIVQQGTVKEQKPVGRSCN